MKSKKLLAALAGLLVVILVIMAGMIGSVVYLGQNSTVPSLWAPPPPTPSILMPQNEDSEVDIPQPSPFELSKPLNPWSIEPVPITAKLLILPFTEDARYTEAGLSLQHLIFSQLIAGLPRHVAVSDVRTVKEMIRRMSPYTNELSFPESPIATDGIARFTTPTHTLRGTLRQEDDELFVSVALEMGDVVRRGEFRVPKEEGIVAAREIAIWIGQEKSLGFSPEQLSAMDGLPFGPNCLDLDSDLYREMSRNAMHDEWKNLAARDDFHPLQLYHRARTANHNELPPELREEWIKGPLPEDADLVDRMTYCLCLDRQDKGKLKHEMELILAQYPGFYNIARYYVIGLFDKGQIRDQYIKAVDEWEKRTRKDPFVNYLVGRAYRESAWDYRGSGWSSTVTAEGWDYFARYQSVSMEKLEQSVAVGGPEPLVMRFLIAAKGSTSDDDIYELHQTTCDAFPAQTDTWEVLLHYIRPRWGGSEREAMQFMRTALDEHPDNPALARLGWIYYNREAALLPKPPKGKHRIVVYCEQHPETLTFLQECMDRLISQESSPRDATYGMMMAAYLHDRERKYIALTNHPDIDLLTEDELEWYEYGQTMNDIVYTNLGLGRWEKVKSILDRTRERDSKLNPKKYKQAWRMAIPNRKWRYPTELLAETMISEDASRVDELAEAWMELNERDVASFVRVHFRKYTSDDILWLESEFAKDPEDPDNVYLLAMIAEIEGDQEKAQKLYKYGNTLKIGWRPIKADADAMFELDAEKQQLVE